jgi:hypothetical protein
VLPAPPPPAPDEAPPAAAPPAPLAAPATPWWRSRSNVWTLAALSVAGCAYLGVVDPNTSSWYPSCPFRSITGYDCPGCGITRALRALVTGHPGRAFDHNALFVVVVVVGTVWFVVNRVRERSGRPPLAFRNPGRWALAAGAVVALWWLGRNLPWQPFAWFGSGASGA